MWYLKLRTFITSVLKDESGANAVEYALIMALVAVFIIAAVILMSTEIANLFNQMAICLSDAVNGSAAVFSAIAKSAMGAARWLRPPGRPMLSVNPPAPGLRWNVDFRGGLQAGGVLPLPGESTLPEAVASLPGPASFGEIGRDYPCGI